MTDETERDGLAESDFDAWLDAEPEDAEPVEEPEEAEPNRYEKMSAESIDKLAKQAVDRTGEADEPLPGPWGSMSDEEFEKALAESQKPAEFIEWEQDVSPGVQLARQHVEIREIGLDGDLASLVLDGSLSLTEAVARREANLEAAQLIEAQPTGLTDSLSDAEFEDLLNATKQGFGDDSARRLAREKGLAS